MRSTGPWIAFLTTLFALVGLCGLFASYATSIPLERAAARRALLEQVLAFSDAPDAAERLRALAPRLDSLAEPLMTGPGTLPERVVAARTVVLDEQQRESVSLTYRVRLMLGVITVLAAGLGAGILNLVARSPRDQPPAGAPPSI
ncbi:MAG: hypothetical protein ACRYGM_14590 [Janthinobacterium lividum]